MSEELLNGIQKPETETTPEEKVEKEQPKSYTQEEVDEIVKRRITRERKKLSSMITGEQRISELDEREQKILKRELMLDAKIKLADNGLPSSLADILNYDNTEECEKQLTQIMSVINDAVNQKVKRILSGQTPRSSSGVGSRDAVAEVFKHKR